MSERFPKDKLCLGLFLVAAFTAFAVIFAGIAVLVRVGKKKEADRGYERQKYDPYVGPCFHDQPFL